MAEKNDWSMLSKKELLEMLGRQEKLLANRELLQSLPDKGIKISETVNRLRELIIQKEKLEDTFTQFEKLTVSQLVQRTRVDLVDSTIESDDNDEMLVESDHQDTADVHQKLNKYKHEKTMDSKSSSGTWDYESAVTSQNYKLEKSKPISLEESFKLLQEQEKRHKDLQAQQATVKLREKSYQVKTEYPSQVLNPLQYPLLLLLSMQVNI